MARTLAIALALLALCPLINAQTTVVLKSSARAQAGETILLKNIATLDGPDADRLGGTVILPGADVQPTGAAAWVEIDLARVRAALDKQGVNWGRLSLSGSRCAARFDGAPKPGAGEPKRVGDDPAGEPQVVDVTGPATIRTMIAANLSVFYGVPNSDLRLSFKSTDNDVLDTPAADRRVDIQPGATASSGLAPVHVYAYAGDRLLLSRIVPVSVLVRRQTVTATTPIDRRDPIAGEQVSIGSTWLSPNNSTPATPEQVIGSLAKTRINAGQVISRDLVEAPIAVKRGQTVEVHCLSGSLHIKARARALGNARDGETVQLQIDGSKKTFTARVNGPGRAVLDLDGSPPTLPVSSTTDPAAAGKEAKP